MTTHSAGCRHNGDGYGTEVYRCKQCEWTTSFQYDDASDCYYYEMRCQQPAVEVEVPPKPVYLTDAMIKKYKRIVCLVPEDGVRLNMKQEGLTPAAIDKFFQLITNEEAQKK